MKRKIFLIGIAIFFISSIGFAQGTPGGNRGYIYRSSGWSRTSDGLEPHTNINLNDKTITDEADNEVTIDENTVITGTLDIQGGSLGVGTTAAPGSIFSGTGQPLNLGSDGVANNYQISADGFTHKFTVTSDNTLGATFQGHLESTSPADGDVVYRIEGTGNDSGDYETIFGMIEIIANDVTAGTEDGEMVFLVQNDGTNTEAMRIDENGRLGIGEQNPTATVFIKKNVEGWLFWVQNDGTTGSNSGMVVRVGDDSGDTQALFQKRDGTTLHRWYADGQRLYDNNAYITIDSDSVGIELGEDQDYSLVWDTTNAVHTITSGDFSFTGGDFKMSNRLYFTVDSGTIPDSGDGNPAEATITPSTSTGRLTCNDSDGCNITLSETGALDGSRVRIINVSANVCNFSDTSGVSELNGAYAMGQYDSLDLEYASDRWVEAGRSDN